MWEFLGAFDRRSLWQLRAVNALWFEGPVVPGLPGVTALGNLVLSRTDLLFLDVKSTVLAEEVARLCYAVLPSSACLFPSALLDSALDKM